jgi:hypothetical protein
MNGNVYIIDDVLPVSLADKLERTLLSPTYPWYYTDDITYSRVDRVGLEDMTFGFFHLLVSGGEQVSPFYPMFDVIYHMALSKCDTGLTNPSCLQARTFLQVPQKTKKLYNNRHVDIDMPHFVCLYYVNDADGDTFMFNGEEIVQRVAPKKNRAVIFDGSIYHSSSVPSVGKRVVVNFNLIGNYRSV